MVLIRAYGHNAAVDLFDHHLVITRRRGGMLFDAAASEQFIPLSSIKSVQFHPAGLVARGRMILTLAGNPSRHPGTESDENTVFFAKGQADQFKQIVHAIRDTIATPSLEQLAMAAQRNRGQERVSQTRPASGATPNMLERIDGPPRYHGTGYDNAGSSGPYDYDKEAPRQKTPSHDPIANLPTGGWWQDLPLAGKVILIAVTLVTVLVTCAKNDTSTSDASEQASSAATGEADAPAAYRACQREDVQDVVGKETRNIMLKANADGVIMAALFGVDMVKPIADANVTFHDVGLYSDPASPLPITQITCGANFQIDASSTQAGQDIVTIPNLRWNINFAQPTQDPDTGGFTIEVDKASIYDGILINGHPPAARNKDEAAPAPAGRSEAEQAAPVDDAAAEAAEAAAADTPQRKQTSPTEDDLYAPHSN
ncbi:hypothetical protein [Novosphingobium sp. UBA1939]|uniref:hypothetical protein n=1 Tax=Novosphingobium sp. UBA1939 TaxID=1946982 RepID=UPI0025D22A41|nr:hypothetical protein [Novosphingobium sp. UBA1939]